MRALGLVASLVVAALSACSPGSTVSPSPGRPGGDAPHAAPTMADAGAVDASALVARARTEIEAKKPAVALDLFTRAWAAGHRDHGTAYDAACAAALSGSVDGAFAWLDRALEAGLDSTAWLERDPDLATVRADARFADFLARYRATAERLAAARHVGAGLTPSTPESEHLDPTALATLLREAERADSSALVLVRDGRLAGRWYFGGAPHRIEAMSATKSIVALAVVAALDDEHIRSLDAPVSTWFPEWKQGRKQRITLRMLLNHTSGLQADANTKEIYESPDFVQLALAAELADDPGTRFFYNNKAVNLLPEIVARATGRPFDVYVRERLFGRLGIEDVTFSKDRAGHVHGMSGLQIQPLDLAKLGQMVMDGGTWQGARVLDEARLSELTRPGQELEPSCGLLWWIRYEKDETTLEAGTSKALLRHGVRSDLVAKIRALEGRTMPTTEFGPAIRSKIGDADRKDLWKALAEVGRRPKRTTGDPVAFEAQGYLGQYLVLNPKARLVAVRMVDARGDVAADAVSMPSFVDLVRALTKP